MSRFGSKCLVETFDQGRLFKLEKFVDLVANQHLTHLSDSDFDGAINTQKVIATYLVHLLRDIEKKVEHNKEEIGSTLKAILEILQI